MKSKKKQILNFFLLIVFTSLVLYFSLKDNFLSIVNHILNVNVIWLLLSTFFVFAHLVFKAISLHDVIRKFKPAYSFKQTMHLAFVTQFFNAITPFATGGQPFQVYTLKKDGIAITSGTNIIMQNFISYQIALVFLGLLAVLYNMIFHLFEEVTLLKNLVTLGFFINVVVIVFLFLIAFGNRFHTFVIQKGIVLLKKLRFVKDEEKTLQKWNTYVSNFHKSAMVLIQDKKMFFKTVGANFISLICLYLVPLSLIYGMGNYDINITQCLAASSYTMLMGAFVPIPGGTGGLEYGYLCFFGNFIKGPVLKASMLLWRGLTYYLGLIVGALFLNIKKR